MSSVRDLPMNMGPMEGVTQGVDPLLTSTLDPNTESQRKTEARETLDKGLRLSVPRLPLTPPLQATSGTAASATAITRTSDVNVHQEGVDVATKSTALDIVAINDLDLSDNSIIFWNCCHGLSNKIDFVRNYIAINKPAVMMISESELSQNDLINIDFFYIKGYTLLHSKTSNKRGEVIPKSKSRLCAYVNNSIQYQRQETLEGQCEMIIIDVRGLRIIGIYHPFKIFTGETSTSNFDRLVGTLRRAASTQNLEVYCGGDFNVDWLKDSNNRDALQAWAYDCDLTQVVSTITRYRSVKNINGTRVEKSLLDHIYIPSNRAGQIQLQQTSTHRSDHDILRLTPCVRTQTRTHFKITKVVIRDWRKYSPAKLGTVLEQMQLAGPIVDISTTLKQAFERLVPNRVVRFKPECGEFPNAKVAKLRKKRDRLIKDFKKTGHDGYLHSAWRVTKEMKAAIKKEKKRVIQKKLETPNPKSFWSVINNLLGKRKYDNTWKITTTESNPEPITDPFRISELFADFFQNKVLSLAKTIPARPIIGTTGPDVEFNQKDLETALKQV